MKPIVDDNRCIGCGLCERMCPTLFVIDPAMVAHVIGEAVAEGDEAIKLEAIADYCPVSAIHLEP